MNISRLDGDCFTDPDPPDTIGETAAPRRDRRLALGVVLAIILPAVAVGPIGHHRAAEIFAFIPAVTSASIVAFALTAALLVAQYRAHQYSPFAILGLAYGAAAALLLAYMLTFPHVFSLTGLLGAGPQTAIWLWVAWHVLFCLIVIGYVAVERSGSRCLSRRAVHLSAYAVAGVVAGIWALTTICQAGLPQLITAGNAFTPLYWKAVLPLIFGCVLAAIAALGASTRLRTREHVWLAVSLLALLAEMLVNAFAAGGRYSYGWYLARTEVAVAATALLMLLQTQYASTVNRIARVNQTLETRNAQIEALIALQDAMSAALPSRAAVIDVILKFAQEQTAADASVLEVADGDDMLYEAAGGTLAPFIGMRHKRAGSLSGMCADWCETLVCGDTATDPRVNRAVCERLGIGSMIVVPIATASAVTAVLRVASPQKFAFGNAEVQTLRLAAKHLAGGFLATREFAKLEKLSQRVTLATKAGKIGIFEWHLASNLMDWDNTMHALYGIDDRTAVPDYDLWARSIHPDDHARAAADISRAVSGEAPLDTEFRVIWSTGEVRHIRAVATLQRDPGNGGARMVGVNWDITEVRVLAEEYREEKQRAEEASRAKSEFLARMSHEIRTPMNGIIGFTTLVLDSELSPEQRRYMTLLGGAGRSLLAIINDVLDFSKIEAGKIELEHIPIDLNGLVDGALSIVRTQAMPKGIALTLEVAADAPAWVNGDPTRLRQILLNLLTNALKFTDRGSIQVTVRRELAPNDDRIRFEIADTGIGIAAEQRHLLFGDFSQLESSTTRRYGGTGLGLAISKRLVEAMRGTIGVESELGSGSLFWFTARLPKIAAPAEDCDSDEPPDQVFARRILVAEDNRVNQIVVESLLARDGHDVVLVENGAQAVEAVKTGRFDLVLMDMQMPVMGGVEATRAIRALAAPTCEVPVVALTANALAEEVELCHAAGMNDHLAKPIERNLLRRAIARWTSGPREPVTADARSLPKEGGVLKIGSGPDTPTLGIATLLDLFDGDLVSVGEIFAAALASIEVDLARIEQAAAARDMSGVVEAAHRMKGTSGSIRSQHVNHVSAAIEQAAKGHPQTINPALLHALSEAVSELRSDLEAHRRYMTATSAQRQLS